jgi:hypothetical protein
MSLNDAIAGYFARNPHDQPMNMIMKLDNLKTLSEIEEQCYERYWLITPNCKPAEPTL